jgi:radical SAM-linked protein
MQWVSPHVFANVVSNQLPTGIQILKVNSVALSLPSLQAQVRYAEYRVEVETKKGEPDVTAALDDLLSLKHLPWQHQRDTGPRNYDLRVLIDDLRLLEWYNGHCTIGMRLRCSSSGTGRPEQVAAALGFSSYPVSIHRTRLILETS